MNAIHPLRATSRITAGLLLGCLLALLALTGSARAAEPAAARAAIGEPPYEQRVPVLIASIDGFWRRHLRGYVAPGLRPAYETTGVSCGSGPVGPPNAFYCPSGRFISWDETHLMRPFYEQAGDMAVGFVLAHEWGHAIQDQMRQRFRLNIFAELEADCFAGAWLRNLYARSQAGAHDLQEVAWAIGQTGDRPGTRIDAPDAHGSAKLRRAWETFGFKRGVRACYTRTQQLMRSR